MKVIKTNSWVEPTRSHSGAEQGIKMDDFAKSQKAPSPLMGEGWGEGE